MTTQPISEEMTLRRPSTPFLNLAGKLIAHLLDADRRYREAQNLGLMPEHRLVDMGITSAEAKALAGKNNPLM